MSREPSFSEHVEFHVTSASRLRARLHDDLDGSGHSDVVTASATHVLYELVMNGVDHGRPDADGRLQVSWEVEGSMLAISVVDAGTEADGQTIVVRAPTPDLPHGRGLVMVAAFSEQWHAERDSEHTRVTAWIALDA